MDGKALHDRHVAMIRYLIYRTLAAEAPDIPPDVIARLAPGVQADTPPALYANPAGVLDWQLAELVRRGRAEVERLESAPEYVAPSEPEADAARVRDNLRAILAEPNPTLAYHPDWPAVSHADAKRGGQCHTVLPAAVCTCGQFLLVATRD